jgi:hypothetical protein
MVAELEVCRVGHIPSHGDIDQIPTRRQLQTSYPFSRVRGRDPSDTDIEEKLITTSGESTQGRLKADRGLREKLVQRVDSDLGALPLLLWRKPIEWSQIEPA